MKNISNRHPIMLKVPNEWTFSTPVGMHKAMSRNLLNISTGGWSHLPKICARQIGSLFYHFLPPSQKKKWSRKDQKSSLQTQPPLERSQFELRILFRSNRLQKTSVLAPWPSPSDTVSGQSHGVRGQALSFFQQISRRKLLRGKK